MYRCIATSIEAFVQQLAVAYVTHGYWFYVTGRIPENKDPAVVDAKIIKRYDIAVSKFARLRRKRAGIANLQYLRYRRCFVLLATHGRHRFFTDEPRFRDARRSPIFVHGYSISYRQGKDGRGHASVRIAPERYRELKAYFCEIATARSITELACEFQSVPFEPYAPIRRQLLNILRAVNRCRATASMIEVPSELLRLKRRPVRVFAEETIEPAFELPAAA